MTPWSPALDAGSIRPGGEADRVDGVAPSWVLSPRDVEAVARVVSVACEGGRALVASGLGRHLDMAAPPRALDAVVRLDRLDRVLAHEPADMTVTVEAGCTLLALDRTLAAAAQWLPIDPPAAAETTVGGLVAANLSGPLRTSQGTVRDWLIGIAVVGAGGRMLRGGGRVVKNVAGYDVPKLHVGAFGTAGVIVEATFKVKPRPASERACVHEAASLGAAFELALALRDRAEPSWLEVERDPDAAGARVTAGFAGSRAWVDSSVARAGGTAVGDGASRRAALSDARGSAGAAVLRVAALPAKLGALLEGTLGSRSDVRVVASPTAGTAHLVVADAGTARELLVALRAAAAPGCFVVVERGTADMKRAIDVWGDVGDAAQLMRSMKRAFDPSGVFAPGRFVGGL